MDDLTIPEVQSRALEELKAVGFLPPGCTSKRADLAVRCPACDWPLRATGIGGPGPVQVLIGPRALTEDGGCDVCRDQLSFIRPPG